jgi:hypothetical protein
VTAAEWTPEFPGQRPAFQPGHELSTRHGAYSPRKVEPRAAELVAMVEDDPSVTWLTPVDRSALWGWARTLAMVERVAAHVQVLSEAAANGVGDLTSKQLAAAHALLDRSETRLVKAESRLGFDPLSRSKLGRNVAAARLDLAKLMADAGDDDDEDQDNGGTGE